MLSLEGSYSSDISDYYDAFFDFLKNHNENESNETSNNRIAHRTDNFVSSISLDENGKFASNKNENPNYINFCEVSNLAIASKYKFSANDFAAEEDDLIIKIRDSYFESGIWTEADRFFDNLKYKYSSLDTPLELLSDITNHNLREEHILEGVLHILSNYDYEEISPFGITISIACAVNHSLVIQDLLISCFEKWDTTDAINILEGLKIDNPWLLKYRDNVLLYLKREKVTA